MTDEHQPPPAWLMPPGVDPSLWRYTHTRRLAEDEDAYFAAHPLFATDRDAVTARFHPPGRLIDLGCGAGRMTIEMARRGFDTTAVELSRPMLEVVAAKAATAGLSVSCLQANLCRLQCIPDGTFDFALSLFSTLGMIRTPGARRAALAEAARILRPGGRLALHAHNIWINAHTWEGRRWLLAQRLASWRNQPHAGDRVMTYRGIPNMAVHLFHWPELRQLLTATGFTIDEVLPLNPVTAQPIPHPNWLPSLRAGGWLLFATRSLRTENEQPTTALVVP
jgi:ubiquinone/menaquinone biosynthesis C-methylase UbiE